MPTVRIGTYTGGATRPSVFYDAKELNPHKGKPWLASYLKKRLDVVLDAEDGPKPGSACDVEAELFRYHALLVGKSGSGKTRLALKLLEAQLADGCSAVVLDTSGETVLNALSATRRAGVEYITLLWPQVKDWGMPEWNPFAGDPDQAVPAFVDTLKALFGSSWGVRMDDILRGAATALAATGFTPFELFDFLGNPGYRDTILFKAYAKLGTDDLYLRFFTEEFAQLSAKQQQEQCAPITNKLRPIFSKPFLRGLLAAPGDTLRLEALWETQRVLLVHLDENALGRDGTQILAGLLTQRLFLATAQRTDPGKHNVLLMLDELETQERYSGEAINELLTKGRKGGVRLLLAAQHLSQASDKLQKSLGSTSFKAYFHLSDDDAPKVAKTLVQGSGDRVERVALDIVRPTGQNPQEYAWDNRALFAETGYKVRLDARTWSKISGILKQCDGMGGLLAVVEGVLASFGVKQLYVKDGQGKVWKLADYVAGLPFGFVAFGGPDPVLVKVAFPLPKVSILGRESEEERARNTARTLVTLPNRQAFVRLQTGNALLVQIDPVEFPPFPDVAAYLRRGQTAEQVAQTVQPRLPTPDPPGAEPREPARAAKTRPEPAGIKADAPRPKLAKEDDDGYL